MTSSLNIQHLKMQNPMQEGESEKGYFTRIHKMAQELEKAGKAFKSPEEFFNADPEAFFKALQGMAQSFNTNNFFTPFSDSAKADVEEAMKTYNDFASRRGLKTLDLDLDTSDIEVQKKNYDKITAAIQTMNDTYAEEKRQFDKLESKYDDIKRKQEMIHKKFDNTHAAMEKSNSVLGVPDRRMQDIYPLDEEWDKESQKRNEIVDSLDEVKKNYESIDASIKDIDEEKKKLQESLKNAKSDAEKDDIQKKLNSLDVKIERLEVMKQSPDFDAIKKKYADLTKEVNDTEAERKKLEEVLKSQKTDEEKADVEYGIEALNIKISDLQESRSKLEEPLNEARKAYKDIIVQIDKLKAEKAHFEDVLQKADTDMGRYEAAVTIKELDIELDNLDIEKNNANSTFTFLKEKYEEATKQIDDVIAERKKLEEVLKSQKTDEEKAEIRKQIEALDLKLTGLKAKQDDAKKFVDEVVDKETKLTKKIDEAKKIREALQKALDNSIDGSAVAEIKRMLGDLDVDTSNLKSGKQKGDELIANMRKKLSDIDEEVKALNEERDKLIDDLNKATSETDKNELISKIEALDFKTDSLRTKRSTVDKDIKNIIQHHAEIDVQIQQIEALKRELESRLTNVKNESEKEDIKKQIEALDFNIDKWNTEKEVPAFRTMKQKYDEATKQVDAVTAERKKLEDKLSKTEDKAEKDKIEKEIKHLDFRIETLNENRKSAAQVLESIMARTKELDAKIETLKELRAAAVTKLNEAADDAKKEEFQKLIKSIDAEIEEVKTEKKANALEMLQKNYEETQAKIDDIRKKRDALIKSIKETGTAKGEKIDMIHELFDLEAQLGDLQSSENTHRVLKEFENSVRYITKTRENLQKELDKLNKENPEEETSKKSELKKQIGELDKKLNDIADEKAKLDELMAKAQKIFGSAQAADQFIKNNKGANFQQVVTVKWKFKQENADKKLELSELNAQLNKNEGLTEEIRKQIMLKKAGIEPTKENLRLYEKELNAAIRIDKQLEQARNKRTLDDKADTTSAENAMTKATLTDNYRVMEQLERENILRSIGVEVNKKNLKIYEAYIDRIMKAQREQKKLNLATQMKQQLNDAKYSIMEKQGRGRDAAALKAQEEARATLGRDLSKEDLSLITKLSELTWDITNTDKGKPQYDSAIYTNELAQRGGFSSSTVVAENANNYEKQMIDFTKKMGSLETRRNAILEEYRDLLGKGSE